MKPKNVMLLGFVNSAVEYLNKHMDEEPDTRLAELKNIDLASLKDELIDNLDVSLGTMQSTMSTLLKAGNEAFDKFVENTRGNGNTLSDQFFDMFDIDLDDTKQSNQKELARLLAFYNLDNDDDAVGVSNSDDELMKKIVQNISNEDLKYPSSTNKAVKQDDGIDNIFNEIVRNEDKTASEKFKEVDINDKKQENQTYVSSLINDLRQKLVKDEQNNKQKKIRNDEVFERISKMYSYLPDGFVRSVYELKEELSDNYPTGVKIIVLHRVAFNDVENLRKFVEIGLNHGYTINADENKKIVDIFKEFINSDGRILTNIYEIANQGYLLNGTYEGYNVIENEG